MTVYNLEGKDIILWHDIKISHGLSENNLECIKLEKLFKKQYISESY